MKEERDSKSEAGKLLRRGASLLSLFGNGTGYGSNGGPRRIGKLCRAKTVQQRTAAG